ncbi:MAG TPA: glycosyltransferase family 2 protein [Chthoniobacterales bacterium]|nr:glycosyltransferase family 2 protein [Chthoniobacterales bacterium]
MSRSEPRISCIIPTLNRGTVVVHTVEQLLAQKPHVPEIILVDQTPQVDPDTEAALSAWRDQGAIKWIRQLEPNASKARNTGAWAANGEILLFLDDDIQIAPDFVEAHAANYRDPKVVAVAGQVLETEGATTTQLQYPADDPELGWIRFPKNYAKRCKTTWMASGNFSIRRDVYFEVGGMDENYRRGAFREESDFAMRFLGKGYRFQFDPSASIVHLGIRAVPGGGARSWSDLSQLHHFIGDWYFNLKYLRWRNARQLLWFSFRHLVTSRRKVARPHLALLSAVMWVAALPIAAFRRLLGSKLIPNPASAAAVKQVSHST